MSTSTLAVDVAVGAYLLATVVAIGIAVWNRREFKFIAKQKSRATIAASPADAQEALNVAPASFSRIVGLCGTIFLSTFLWGLGLYLLVNLPIMDNLPSADEATRVSNYLVGYANIVRDYVLAAAALFAPYAVNQLSQALGGLRAAGGTGRSEADETTISPAPQPTWL